MKKGFNSFLYFFKDYWLSLVLAIVASVLVYFELVTLYANNPDDFWFDFYTMAQPTLQLALLTLGGVLTIMTLGFLLSKVSKKTTVYHVLLILAGGGVLIAYLHAEFLAGSLPGLDGTEPDFAKLGPNVISIVTCLFVLAGVIFATIKWKPERVAKTLGFVELAVIIMLGTSFLSVALTSPLFEEKEVIATTTTKNLNLVSTNENYFVVLVDAVDAPTFERAIKNLGKAEEFKDFTYFPDTISGYPFTRDSIPLIFSGVWNENKEPFIKYSTGAYDGSVFLNEMEKEYAIKNFYDEEIVWQSRKVLNYDNVESIMKNVETVAFLKQEIKYVLFKTLPYPLKKFARIETMDFKRAQGEGDNPNFGWSDRDFYFSTLEKPAEKTNEKLFSYIHLEGAHVPLNLDKNLNEVDGSYDDKVEATVVLLAKYLNYLKLNDAYNNAKIILLADHGYDAQGKIDGRQNPLLMVKAANEAHEEIAVSKKQVSHGDLAKMMMDLMDGKTSEELFTEIPTEGRKRRYLWYAFLYEDNMIEKELDGKAWETEKLINTGREFNL